MRDFSICTSPTPIVLHKSERQTTTLLRPQPRHSQWSTSLTLSFSLWGTPASCINKTFPLSSRCKPRGENSICIRVFREKDESPCFVIIPAQHAMSFCVSFFFYLCFVWFAGLWNCSDIRGIGQRTDIWIDMRHIALLLLDPSYIKQKTISTIVSHRFSGVV